MGTEGNKVMGSGKGCTRRANGGMGRKEKKHGHAKGGRAENCVARSCLTEQGDCAKSVETFLGWLRVA